MITPTYLHDPYLTELETKIVETGIDGDRPWAVSADTIFYPEGGGQPADRGRMGSRQVVDVQKVDGRIRHTVDGPLEKGPIRLELDWARRWDHMQQHTAQHRLTAVALARFGWRTTAFHLGDSVSDIELDTARITMDEIERLEDSVVEEIRTARPVTSRTADVSEFEELGVRSRLLPHGFEGPVRLVEIEGLDLNTCGGTHLRSTSEIGTICLLPTEPMRGGLRLHFVAGDRVRRRMSQHEARNAELRSLLDSADDDLPDIVSIRLTREKALARASRLMAAELAEYTAAAFSSHSEPVVEGHWNDRDMGFLQTVARRLVEGAPHKLGLLTATAESGSVFVVVAGPESGIDLGTIGSRVAETLGGRGGGKPPIFQGKADSLANREQALEILRGA